MADEPIRVSALPTSNTVGFNDRIMFLYQANTATPSVRTVTANNATRTMFAGLPTYSNNANAVSGGLPTGALYKTATGEIRIVV